MAPRGGRPGSPSRRELAVLSLGLADELEERLGPADRPRPEPDSVGGVVRDCHSVRGARDEELIAIPLRLARWQTQIKKAATLTISPCSPSSSLTQTLRTPLRCSKASSLAACLLSMSLSEHTRKVAGKPWSSPVSSCAWTND